MSADRYHELAEQATNDVELNDDGSIMLFRLTQRFFDHKYRPGNFVRVG